MEKFIITGGNKLSGEVMLSGAKNVALKVLVAACLTDEEVVVNNIPLISDFFTMAEIIRSLGGNITIQGHTAKIQMKQFSTDTISLEKAAYIRTSVMFLAPLLVRLGKAVVPNPGGCRIGARPIDRIIEGLKSMGADIVYNSDDGYFHGKIKEDKDNQTRLKGCTYTFIKNTHTGTETLMLAAVLAEGKTNLMNAAEEPEIDELIRFLNSMGAQIKRTASRTIEIQGVTQLHGTIFSIDPDRNEAITFAIAAILTGGDIQVLGIDEKGLKRFLTKLTQAGGGVEKTTKGIRFFAKETLLSTTIKTSIHPGFMTDWQGPWAVLMTKANGTSVIHETVYENRFGYVEGLRKMGADIELFNPMVENPKEFYNFNYEDDKPEYKHAIKILGPSKLHNGIVTISDLRAGATLVLAALAAWGTSVIFGIEHLDRGYEQFETRLKTLGAQIERVIEE